MTIYYVDTTASDNSDTGLIGHPWAELPGTISPLAGNWNGTTIIANDTIYLTAGQTWNKGVLISSARYNNGTVGNPITITSSSTSTRATFDFLGGSSNLSDGAAIDIRRNYITVQYLEIANITRAGGMQAVMIGQDAGTASDHCKLLYCYIHDMTDSNELPTENYSYGISLLNRTNTEIGYNIIKNVDKKWINSNENYVGGDEIHHNVLYNEASYVGGAMDHGIAVSCTGGYNLIHDNIIWNLHEYYGACYAINLVEAGSYNKVYNNIIRGHTIGIVVRTSGVVGNYDEIIHNTIYLANCPMTYTPDLGYGQQHRGIYLEDGTGHIIKNNIVYYPALVSGTARMVTVSAATNLTITNNLFYREGTDERFFVDGSPQTLTYFNDTWDAEGGTCSNNVVQNPNFLGGSYPVSNLPDGFDTSWHPNNTGLRLTASIPGDNTVGATYATDIQGNTRVNYDVGAYEYQGDEISPKGLASSEPFRIGAITHKQNPRKIHSKH